MYSMQPITYTYGTEIQAPYRTILQPGNIESGVALGPASRLAGECLARHVSQPGMCWGKFTSQNTRAVDQYDPMVSGALETQWALASQPRNTLNATGNASNILSYAGSQSTQQLSASIENKQTQMNKASDKMAKQAEKDAKKQAQALAKAAKEAKKQADKAAKAVKSGATCSKDGSCSSCQ